MKVIYMLAIHELGETIIGDLTLFQISKEEKEQIDMWLKFGQKKYPYDDNFRSVSSYMIGNNLENNQILFKKNKDKY